MGGGRRTVGPRQRQEWPVDAAPCSYFPIERRWKSGDTVEILLPMHFSVEAMPNVPDYISLLYGPVVLAARMGTEDLEGLVADDGRWGHIASGRLLPLDGAPAIAGTADSALARLRKSAAPVDGKPLHYTCEGLFSQEEYRTLELEPFAGIHDCRYSVYFRCDGVDK